MTELNACNVEEMKEKPNDKSKLAFKREERSNKGLCIVYFKCFFRFSKWKPMDVSMWT